MPFDSIPLTDLESSPSAKFNEFGDTVKGTITALNERQQTDLKTGSPKTFSDGSPMMLWVITLETEAGDSVNVYAKGGKYRAEQGSGESLLAAIASAVRRANATSVEIGGQLAVKYSGLGESSQAGFNAPKLFEASYKAPAKATTTTTEAPLDLFSPE